MRKAALWLLSLMLCCLWLAPARAEAALTLMVYMCGSDLESRGGAASDDLAEMMKALPGDGSVQVLVMASGAKSWRAEVAADETSLYRVGNKGLEKVKALPLRSMGESATLSAFLQEAAELCPAQRYALIFWDHGAGPLMGVCFDELHPAAGGMDSLTLNEVTAALDNSPFAREKLIFVGFDACLMATAEVAHAMAPYAEYMVASQEPEPARGWDYAFIGELAPGMTGADMGKSIIDRYAAACEGSLTPVTLSCLDLSWADELAEALESLLAPAPAAMDWGTYAAYARCRAETKVMGCSTPAAYDLVDLRDLGDMLEAEGLADAQPLRRALDGMVTCSYATEEYTGGLSIYYPFDNKPRYALPWGQRYAQLDFSPAYRGFVQAVGEIWLGAPMEGWEELSAPALEPDAHSVAMPLTDAQAANIASARYTVLEKITDTEYRQVYISDDMTLLDGVLSAGYRNEALYLQNGRGEIIAGPVTYRRVEGGVALGVLLESAVWSPGSTESAYLVYMDRGGGYELSGVLGYDEGMELFTRSALRLEDFATAIFVGWGRIPPEDALPFMQWPFGETVTVESVRLTEEGFTPVFLPLESGEERYICLEVTDLQGNVHCSPLMKIE